MEKEKYLEEREVPGSDPRPGTKLNSVQGWKGRSIILKRQEISIRDGNKIVGRFNSKVIIKNTEPLYAILEDGRPLNYEDGKWIYDLEVWE